jgi:hypothetical protein
VLPLGGYGCSGAVGRAATRGGAPPGEGAIVRVSGGGRRGKRRHRERAGGGVVGAREELKFSAP